MKKSFTYFLSALLLCLLNLSSIAQQESANWYFGNDAGVSFSGGSPIALSNGVLTTHEGSASISDAAGNLLFYTNGVTVYNAAHVQMSNGSGLMADASSTQGALILPLPGSSNLYYIFTIDDASGSDGFRYSIVDMTLDNGLGAVTDKNVLIHASAKEKITAVKNANGVDYWVIINSYINDDLRAFNFGSSGIDTVNVSISNIGPINNGIPAATAGYLKASKQGDRLAMASMYRDIFIVVNFNNSTGLADSSSRITLGNSSSFNNTYGVEFSPDGSKLYASTISAPRLLMQFDLSSGNESVIFDTRDTLEYVASSTCGAGNFYFGAIQLGPDGKIYGVCPCDSFLNVVNYPDSLGSACGYSARAISLGSMTCDLGLPNFVTTDVLPNGIESIVGEQINFSVYPNPVSNDISVSINDSQPISLTSFTIVDILGDIVKAGSFNSASTKIDVSKLEAGVYFLRIGKGFKSTTKKIIVD